MRDKQGGVRQCINLRRRGKAWHARVGELCTSDIGRQTDRRRAGRKSPTQPKIFCSLFTHYMLAS